MKPIQIHALKHAYWTTEIGKGSHHIGWDIVSRRNITSGVSYGNMESKRCFLQNGFADFYEKVC